MLAKNFEILIKQIEHALGLTLFNLLTLSLFYSFWLSSYVRNEQIVPIFFVEKIENNLGGNFHACFTFASAFWVLLFENWFVNRHKSLLKLVVR